MVTHNERGRLSRAAMMGRAAGAGAGLLLTGVGAGRPSAMADDVVPGDCNDSVRTILDAALTGERVAAAFYYTVLTMPPLLHDHRLGGRVASVAEVGTRRAGAPEHVRYLQGSLDAEAKHAALLREAGASSPVTHAYFPAGTFAHLGASADRRSALSASSCGWAGATWLL